MPYIPVAVVEAGGGTGGLFDAYALLRDEKTAGTSGGAFNSGAWRTRTLNTEKFDPDGIVSLAADQFTLQAGTYFIKARAPAVFVDRHQCKIRNITDSTDDIIGAGQFNDNNGAAINSTDSVVQGRITIAGAKTFELQHQCGSSDANGFGIEANFGVTEVYSEVEIWREA